MKKFLKALFSKIVKLFSSEKKDKLEQEVFNRIFDVADSIIEEVETIKKRPKAIHIGFICGHNEQSQGAANCLGQSEFEFAKEIFSLLGYPLYEKSNSCPRVLPYLKDDQVKIILWRIIRPAGVPYVKQCQSVETDLHNLGIKAAVEQHFNAATSKAKGCEILVYGLLQSIPHLAIARRFCRNLKKVFGSRIRGDLGDGIIKVERGGRSHNILRRAFLSHIPYYVLEPAFNTEEKFFRNKEDYIEKVLIPMINELAEYELQK